MGNDVVKEEVSHIEEEEINPVKEFTVEDAPEDKYMLEDISSDACEIESTNTTREIEIYCKHLVRCNFRGQTNLNDEKVNILVISTNKMGTLKS